MLDEVGTADLFCLNGLDGNGHGSFVVIGTQRSELSAEDMRTFSRLAAHLASAYRCRRRLRRFSGDPINDSEAVFDPDGRMLDARGPAGRHEARDSLTAAADSIRSVRQCIDRSEPTDRWRPLIDGRWTLVDAHTRGGDHYLIARENRLAPAGLTALTEREQQVVALAAMDRSPKEIAYELGISYSSVRVLLSRSYARLGVKSRAELLSLPAIRALRGC